MIRRLAIAAGLVFVVMPIVVPRVVRGQEAPVPVPEPAVREVQVFATGDGAGGIVVQRLESSGGNIVYSEGLGAGTLMAMPMMGGYGAADDSMSLLNMEQIQQELELIEPQIEQFRKLQVETQKRQGDLMRRMAKDGVRQPDVMAAIQDELREMRAQARTEAEKLLLPHQVERLQQVARQVRLQRRGTANGLIGSDLADELGLTDEQKEKLKERAKEIEAELQQEILRLRKKAEEKILGELTPAQQAKLEQLLGKQIDVRPASRPNVSLPTPPTPAP